MLSHKKNDSINSVWQLGTVPTDESVITVKARHGDGNKRRTSWMRAEKEICGNWAQSLEKGKGK